MIQEIKGQSPGAMAGQKRECFCLGRFYWVIHLNYPDDGERRVGSTESSMADHRDFSDVSGYPSANHGLQP